MIERLQTTTQTSGNKRQIEPNTEKHITEQFHRALDRAGSGGGDHDSSKVPVQIAT